MSVPEHLRAVAAQVQGIVFDVDGVLTNGAITYSDDGHEYKQFHVQDGAALKLLLRNEIAVGVITGRRSPIVARRCRELGITQLIQGAQDKAIALDELIGAGFPGTNLAAVGDDLQDLNMYTHPSMALKITVPNAHPALLAQADWITTRAGGEGVVVDISIGLLQARGAWKLPLLGEEEDKGDA